MSIQLSSDREAFVPRRVTSGLYGCEADVLREAFSLLEKREELLDHLNKGIAQLNRGDLMKFGDGDVREFRRAIEAASQRLGQAGL